MLTLDAETLETLRTSLVTPELIRLPRNVYVEIGTKLYPLKVRPIDNDPPVYLYTRLDAITDVRDTDLSWLSGESIIVEKTHFNMRGKEVINYLDQKLEKKVNKPHFG